MPSFLPNEEQRQLARAAVRVLRDYGLEWNANRTGDPREDLRALGETIGRIRGKAPTAPRRTHDRERSVWGWGYEGEGPDERLVRVFLAFLAERFGLAELPVVTPPPLDTISLRPPRFELAAELTCFCTSATRDRASHSYGKAFRDIVRGLEGRYDNPPDYVAYPESEAHIVALLAFCAAEGVAAVPFGGGTSVVGGVEPTSSAGYAGVITVDLRRLDRVLEVDRLSRAARVQAGIYGPALEAALAPHGLSPRFYPQSFEFSTLGGWIATRAGGHYCTLYTHIDDIVESVRVVTPRGVHESRRLPGSGAGPSQERLWLGSEGTLGIITEAWIRLHAKPRFRASAVVKFDTFLDGAVAVRDLSQSKLYPVNCRLVSRVEAVSMGLGDGRHAMLLLGFESERYPQSEPLARAIGICVEHGGRLARGTARESEAREGARRGAAGSWRENFIKAPYLRDILASRGLVIETFETAITWDAFERFHRGVVAAAERAFEEVTSGRGLITVRFTHVYPDGPAVYYSVVAPSEPGRQVETWDHIKARVSDAIIDGGGTITHHHAVGRDHRPWYERERGELFGAILSSAKDAVDPKWVLNPGVLLEESR